MEKETKKNARLFFQFSLAKPNQKGFRLPKKMKKKKKTHDGTKNFGGRKEAILRVQFGSGFCVIPWKDQRVSSITFI